MNLNISKKDAEWVKLVLTQFMPHDPATDRICKKIENGLKVKK
ncbi:hypothetical protein P9265_14945 [Schinkia azotoformans]|nr:hypothetical protein [Schinkia azotoformans]